MVNKKNDEIKRKKKWENNRIYSCVLHVCLQNPAAEDEKRKPDDVIYNFALCVNSWWCCAWLVLPFNRNPWECVNWRKLSLFASVTSFLFVCLFIFVFFHMQQNITSPHNNIAWNIFRSFVLEKKKNADDSQQNTCVHGENTECYYSHSPYFPVENYSFVFVSLSDTW